MKIIVFFLLVSFASFVACTKKPPIKSCTSIKFSYYNDCSDCEDDEDCKPGCKCYDGFEYDPDVGECKLICGKHAHPDYCPQSKCKTGKKSHPLCCPACVCDKGYELDKDGNCVKCKSTPKCGKNEVPTLCYSSCNEYCKKPGEPSVLCKTAPCPPYRPGCQCRKGYKRDKITQECIREEDCPYICPKNEHRDTCGNSCPATCDDLYPDCCDDVCKDGCFCDEGLVRDLKTGKCIRPCDCPCNDNGNNGGGGGGGGYTYANSYAIATAN